jgi:hypothetical protein
MQFESAGRRSFLKTMGAAGVLSALPEAAFGLHAGGGSIVFERGRDPERSHAIQLVASAAIPDLRAPLGNPRPCATARTISATSPA